VRRLLAMAFVTISAVLSTVAVAAAQVYPPTTEVAGTTVTRGTEPATEVAGASASRLPFTGSDNSLTYLLVGLAAIGIGTVLIVAFRRRAEVLARS